MDEATRLIESGYRAVSNKHRGVSRLDRPDWLEHMAYRHVEGFRGDPAANLADGMRWATGLGAGAADHYRRCHSGDMIYHLPDDVYDRVRKAGAGSGWGGLDRYVDAVDGDVTAAVLEHFGPRCGTIHATPGGAEITREDFGRLLREAGEISFHDEDGKHFIVRRGDASKTFAHIGPEAGRPRPDMGQPL